MSDESSLRRYLQLVRDDWKQIFDAIRKDIRYSKLTPMEKDDEREAGRPQGGWTDELLAKLANSKTSLKLLQEAIAESAQAGPSLQERITPRIEALHARHEEILKLAWDCWEQEVYYGQTDPRFLPALDSAEQVASELDKYVLAVEQLLAKSRAIEAGMSPGDDLSPEQSNRNQNKISGYNVDESRRIVMHDGKKVDLSRSNVQWHIFMVAWEAYPDSYTLANLGKDYPGEYSNNSRKATITKLNQNLKKIDLLIKARKLIQKKS